MALKELEDYPWFPAILRKYQMEFIGIMVSKLRLYNKVVDIISEDLNKYGITDIEDLCSGSGFPAIFMHNNVDINRLTTTLTDKYPQIINTTTDIDYHQETKDITTLEISPRKYYTMYNAFHHFDTKDQKALIQKVINNKGHLLIVEIVQPTIFHFLLVTLASIFGVILLCPLIRPFEWKRLFFTYIIPINLLTVLIDGYISILKSKTG